MRSTPSMRPCNGSGTPHRHRRDPEEVERSDPYWWSLSLPPDGMEWGAVEGEGQRRGRRPGRAMNIRESVIGALRDGADPIRALQQQAYMRSDMP